MYPSVWLPVNMPSCRRMVREINGLAMLQGARGHKPCDLEALAEAACLISHMVDELRDIAEVDLNPVFAWEKGLARGGCPASCCRRADGKRI